MGHFERSEKPHNIQRGISNAVKNLIKKSTGHFERSEKPHKNQRVISNAVRNLTKIKGSFRTQ